MKLPLTTWQRVICAQIIGSIGGANAAIFRKAARLLDALELSDEEKQLVGFSESDVPLEIDLTGLESRFGFRFEAARVGDEEIAPNHIFVRMRIPTGQTMWSDKERRFEVEIKDGNDAALLRENVKAHKWQPGVLATRETRLMVADLYDQLGIGEDETPAP